MVPYRTGVSSDRVHTAFEGARSGSGNMQRDLELAAHVQRGTLDGAFRTYQWQPWTLSLGRHQKPDVADHAQLVARNLDLVTRPTGGRAVFHADEITYAVMVRTTAPRLFYQRVHLLLLQAISTLVPGRLDLTSKPTDLRQHYAASGPLGQACFTASAATEILCEGRKVVGSAQRILDGDVVLQHGSILCGPAHLEVADLLRIDEAERSRLRTELDRTSTDLSAIAAHRVDPLDVAQAIQKVFTADVLRNLTAETFQGDHHAS